MEATVPQVPAPPRVSVILIAHDHAAELPRAVAAIGRSQNREQIEIIVVDCASTDETGSLDLPGVNILRLPQNFGATKAMNIGLRTAKADLLFFLSPAIEVQPDTIARMADRLEQAADTSAVIPFIVDAAGQPVARIDPVLKREQIDTQCFGQRKLELRTAFLVRRQFILGMNYLDERYGEYWADVDLAVKISRAQRRIAIDPEIRVTLPEHNPSPNDVDHQADRILGAALLLRKYSGFGAAFGFRFGAMAKALAGFNFSLAGALFAGRTIGSEASASRPL